MIELRGVALTYDETRVLDGVDLAIDAGEVRGRGVVGAAETAQLDPAATSRRSGAGALA